MNINLVKNGNQSIGGPESDPVMTAISEASSGFAADANPLNHSEADLKETIKGRISLLCANNQTNLCRLFGDGIVSLEVQFTRKDARKTAAAISAEYGKSSNVVTSRLIEMLSSQTNPEQTGQILDEIAQEEHGVNIIFGLLAKLPLEKKITVLLSMSNQATAAQVIEYGISISPNKHVAQKEIEDLIGFQDLARRTFTGLNGGYQFSYNRLISGIEKMADSDLFYNRLTRLSMFLSAAWDARQSYLEVHADETSVKQMEALQKYGFEFSKRFLMLLSQYESGPGDEKTKSKLQRKLGEISAIDLKAGRTIMPVFVIDPKNTGSHKFLIELVEIQEKNTNIPIVEDETFKEWLKNTYERSNPLTSTEEFRQCYHNHKGLVDSDVERCAQEKITDRCFQSALAFRGLSSLPKFDVGNRVTFDIVRETDECRKKDGASNTVDNVFLSKPGSGLEGVGVREGHELHIIIPDMEDGTEVLFTANGVQLETPEIIRCTPDLTCHDALGRPAFTATSIEDAIALGKEYFSPLRKALANVEFEDEDL